MKELTCVLEDNEIKMDFVCWGGRGNKKLIKIQFSDRLRYDRFKQNLKSYNFMYSMIEALYDNVEEKVSSCLINLCYHIAECYEDEFVSAAGISDLTFSGSISAIEYASMINDDSIDFSQLRISLRILRHKIGAKLFEPESKMTDLCGDMIVLQLGEYEYIHEIVSKRELILYMIRDYVAIFKKEISLLITPNQLKVDEIFRIDEIVGGDHGQGTFRFPIKLLFVIKSEKMLNKQVVLLIFYANNIMVVCSRIP